MDLIYGLSFRIKAASFFPQSWIQKTGLIFYLADFHGRHWSIPVFLRTRRNIEPYSPLKPIKVGFIFIRPNSLSREVEPKILQLSITWHKLSSELGRRLGLKAGFKELRLEPKILNRGLRINKSWMKWKWSFIKVYVWTIFPNLLYTTLYS